MDVAILILIFIIRSNIHTKFAAFIESVLHNDLREFKEPRIVEEEDEPII